MAKIISNQCVLQQSTKEQWHFFYLSTTGICYKKRINAKWSDYEILLKEGQGDFDVTVDAKNNIHLICQDKLGTIIYLMYNGQQWNKYTILQSKTNRAYPKHFKIMYINNWINLFYIIDYKDKSLLVHHMLDNSNVPPAVVDYVIKNERPFSISVDNSNNIHAYYQSEIEKDRIGYSVYLWSKKAWSNFTPIEHQDKDASLPYILIDREDNMHLIYLRKNDRFYDIAYTRKSLITLEKELWDKETTIYSRCYGDTLPIILKASTKLWILWQQDIKIYSSSSDDNGTTWTKALPFTAPRYGTLSLFGCRLSPDCDESNFICDHCYGHTTNSEVNLYLISAYLEQLPDKKIETQYKVDGYEIEEFARKNSKSFTESQKTEAFFPPSSVPAPPQLDSGTDNVEITKLKIMMNMLQEELLQTKKKLLELNHMPKIDEELRKELDAKYGIEIENLRENFQNLLTKITHIEETQNNVACTTIERMNKEILLLKRQNQRQSFDDLIEKATNNNATDTQ